MVNKALLHFLDIHNDDEKEKDITNLINKVIRKRKRSTSTTSSRSNESDVKTI